MKKLSKEKRQQLVLVILVTMVVIAGFWYGIINLQNAQLGKVSKSLEGAKERLSKVQQAVQSADKIEADLKVATQKIGAIEDGMASGDMFSWFVLMLREFQLNHKVEIPQISRESTGEVLLLPDFPYKQATYTLRGTAFYQDIGKFLAEFENRFTYIRLQNLELEPNPSSIPGEMEKLGFKMEVLALVKPTGP
jgi:Tfp pilus assembly protein PilO